MIPFEFRHDLWRQKTRVMGLSCGVVCVILCLAVLIQYRRVTDRQTDRHTHTHTHRHTTTANTALSIALRGKNCILLCIQNNYNHYPKILSLYNSITHKNKEIYNNNKAEKLRDNLSSKFTKLIIKIYKEKVTKLNRSIKQ